MHTIVCVKRKFRYWAGKEYSLRKVGAYNYIGDESIKRVLFGKEPEFVMW